MRVGLHPMTVASSPFTAGVRGSTLHILCPRKLVAELKAS